MSQRLMRAAVASLLLVGLGVPAAQATARSRGCGNGGYQLAEVGEMASATIGLLADPNITIEQWTAIIETANKNGDTLICYQVQDKQVPGHDGAAHIKWHDNTGAP